MSQICLIYKWTSKCDDPICPLQNKVSVPVYLYSAPSTLIYRRPIKQFARIKLSNQERQMKSMYRSCIKSAV